MELRPAFQIPALIKSLTDVVLPAVDPANKLAQEQGQLIVGMLALIAQRLPLQYRYDRHELDSFIALADAVHAQGLKLVLDGVFNHMGRHAPIFREAEADQASPYREWFVFGDQFAGGARAWAGAGACGGVGRHGSGRAGARREAGGL